MNDTPGSMYPGRYMTGALGSLNVAPESQAAIYNSTEAVCRFWIFLFLWLSAAEDAREVKALLLLI